MSTEKDRIPLPSMNDSQTEHDDKALLVPEDEQIADAEIAYGRDHDNRFAHYKRGPAEHRCTGLQCEDKEDF